MNGELMGRNSSSCSADSSDGVVLPSSQVVLPRGLSLPSAKVSVALLGLRAAMLVYGDSSTDV